MSGRYQQILRRLRLLVACLLLTVVFEPPIGPVMLAERAVATMAGSPGRAPRLASTTPVASRLARAQCAPTVRADAGSKDASWVPSARAESAPALDGRYRYLAHCALLC